MTDRELFEKANGETWNTSELQKTFEVLGFMWGLCAVRRKSDNVEGALSFTRVDNERLYFDFR